MDHFLVSKQDLESFSQYNIKLLADHYGVSATNQQDLLWILAISILTSFQYAKMPPDRVWAKYAKRLLGKFAKDPSAKKDIINELPIEMINADPTPAKKYLEWIITSYLNGGIKRFEDMGRTRVALQEYAHLLRQKLIENKFEQNIGAFCGLAGCSTQGKETTKEGLDVLLDRYKDVLGEMRTEKGKVRKQDVKKIYKDKDVQIVSPLTTEASCKYGAGTKWCTTGREDNPFEAYIQEGPIYILIPNTPQYDGEKYQIHFESDQYMNEKDEKVIYSFLKDRFPSIKNLPIFTKVSALKDAIKKKDINKIKMLIKDPDIQSSTKNGILLNVFRLINEDLAEHTFSQHFNDQSHSENIAMIKLLLDNVADPSISNNDMIFFATKFGWIDVIDMLISDDRIDASYVFLYTICNTDPYILKAILKSNKISTDAFNTALMDVAEGCPYGDALSLLLADGRADPTVNDNELIKIASKKRLYKMVEELLKDGRADPTVNDNELLRSVIAILVRPNIRQHKIFSQLLNILRLLSQDKRVDPIVLKTSTQHLPPEINL